MDIWSPNNPGISGLDEITSSEEVVLQQLDSLGDPNADRILFWDDSAGSFAYLTVGSGLTVSGTTITASGIGGSTGASDNRLIRSDGVGGTTIQASAITVDDSGNTSGMGTLGVGAITTTGLLTASLAGNTAQFVNTSDSAAVQVARFEGDRATMADNDEAYISLMLSNDGGTQKEFARLRWIATDVNTGTSEDGSFRLAIMSAGSLTNSYIFNVGSFTSSANDQNSLGTASASWSDLFLASGGVINFGNGEVTLTSAADSITLAGGDLALGANSLTMTGSIAATGARVTKGWFTDLESTNMPTVGGTAILTSLTAPQFTTIELGNASDTTLSRSAAGQLAVEGVDIITTSNTKTLTNKTLTSPIITTDQTTYAVEPGADDTAYGDILAGILGGDTIAQWDLVYLDSTSGRWELADADAAANAGSVLVALAMTSSTDGGSLNVLLKGIVRNDGWNWTTTGGPLYASTTAAAITQTQPSGTDDVIRVLGYALSDDCIWFNPSNDWITHT